MSCRSRPLASRTKRWAPRRRWRCSLDEPEQPIKIPETLPGRSRRCHGLRQVHVRGRHFLVTEVVSSDFCRGLVADDENDQKATDAAFEVLYLIAAKRLDAGRLTVVDATNVQPESRREADRTGKGPRRTCGRRRPRPS